MIYRLLRDLLGLLFPELCAACGTHLYRGEQCLCSKCLYDLPYSDHHLHADNRAAKKFWGRLPLGSVFALLHFKKGNAVQRILHSLKYRNQPDLGVKLGRMIAEKLVLSGQEIHPDIIIPVPLHHKREKLRGYNQSLCIAKGIAEILQIPLSEGQLKRNIATKSQTKKNRYSRYENMIGVFHLQNAAILKGKHVLLVDDVITTGATLEACATTLLKHNVNKISIAAAAFAD